MDRRQNSLALMLYASLGALAAGINFYWTVDDTPLAAAMRNYLALFTSWNLSGPVPFWPLPPSPPLAFPCS